jgi:hypothetical protein
MTTDSDNSDTNNQNKNEVSLPQKKFYRQRAHSNPLNDHSFI